MLLKSKYEFNFLLHAAEPRPRPGPQPSPPDSKRRGPQPATELSRQRARGTPIANQARQTARADAPNRQPSPPDSRPGRPQSTTKPSRQQARKPSIDNRALQTVSADDLLPPNRQPRSPARGRGGPRSTTKPSGQQGEGLQSTTEPSDAQKLCIAVDFWYRRPKSMVRSSTFGIESPKVGYRRQFAGTFFHSPAPKTVFPSFSFASALLIWRQIHTYTYTTTYRYIYRYSYALNAIYTPMGRRISPVGKATCSKPIPPLRPEVPPSQSTPCFTADN